MSALLQQASSGVVARPCDRCGLAVDARPFDKSGVADLPLPGREKLLARVQLAPQYCGVLEYFSQYADAPAVETPGLQWLIRVNGQVLAPYEDLQLIVNPWGFGSFQFLSRLPDGATVEFLVRRQLGAAALAGVTRVGGRLVGRSWYDSSYGGRLSGPSGHAS